MRCELCGEEATYVVYKGDVGAGDKHQLCHSCLWENRRAWSVSCVFKAPCDEAQEQGQEEEWKEANLMYHYDDRSRIKGHKQTPNEKATKTKDALHRRSRKTLKNFSH